MNDETRDEAAAPPATFSSDTANLQDWVAPALVELADGDTFDLRIAPVVKTIGDDRVRMLAYNGSVPGPTLRVPQSAEISVRVRNDADVDATVHWHGLRLDNAYDGVPYETQAPIPLGGEFTYRSPSPTPVCTGTTRTSVRTTGWTWASTGTSWWSRPRRATGPR
jgi:FtsP/CotA-like multicopper oxidase with cupredoxin domain